MINLIILSTATLTGLADLAVKYYNMQKKIRVVKDSTRKAVDLSPETIRALKLLILDEPSELKPWMELQLVAMAECKVSYVDLWASNQALADALEQLRNKA